MCWARDEAQAVKTAHRLWANEQLPGQLAQELALPALFEQASQLVTEDMVASSLPCGPDPQRHLQAVRAYSNAGFDEVYVNQIGSDQDGFFAFYRDRVLPGLQ